MCCYIRWQRMVWMALSYLPMPLYPNWLLIRCMCIMLNVYMVWSSEALVWFGLEWI